MMMTTKPSHQIKFQWRAFKIWSEPYKMGFLKQSTTMRTTVNPTALAGLMYIQFLFLAEIDHVESEHDSEHFCSGKADGFAITAA